MRRTSHRKSERGGAMVETALGLLVFVTILVFGIHFAEIGYLSPKVAEAQMNALWDATGKRLHEHPNNYAPRTQAMNDADSKTTQRYHNWDGRTGVTATAPSLVFTQAQDLTVTCERDDLETNAMESGVYTGGSGGLSCAASGNMTLVNFPRDFLDQGAKRTFHVKHYNRGGTGIPICALGRAGGGCRGQIAILLDDWGLASAPQEPNSYFLDGTDDGKGDGLGANQPFHSLVKKVYDGALPPGAAGGALATLVSGVDPSGGELTFWFSYGNPYDPVYEALPKDSGNSSRMQTNVRTFNKNSAYHDHTECFLGHTGLPPCIRPSP